MPSFLSAMVSILLCENLSIQLCQNLSMQNYRLHDANYRANGATVLFLHANHDIATARLVKVVGEGADGAIDGIWVPARLVFYAFAFHSATAEQFFYVDGESHICR